MARSYKSALGWTYSGYHDPGGDKRRHNIAVEIAFEYVEDGQPDTVLGFVQRVEHCFLFYDDFKIQEVAQGPVPGDIRKEFEDICDAAFRLEKMLSNLSDPAQEIIQSLELQAGETIDDAIRIISELRACTDRAYSMAKQAVKKGLKSQPQTNERDLAHGLIAAYVKLTGEIPKMGRDAMTVPGAIREDGEQKFDGPFHLFVSDAFARYGINLSPDTIAGYIRAYLSRPSL